MTSVPLIVSLWGFARPVTFDIRIILSSNYAKPKLERHGINR